MRTSLLRTAALCLIAAACAPNPKPPVKVVVLVYDYTTATYKPQTVELTTVTNVANMDGPVAHVIGGASFVINSNDPALQTAQTEDDVLLAIRKRDGGPVGVSFIESDGVLVPADFHSLNITTTYYNFERAFGFFNRIATLKTEQFGTPTVYYWADLVMESKAQLDNAAFMSLAKGFMILPFDKLQQVPLSINGGVVGHEYGHAVFNYRVYGGQMLPQTPAKWENTIGASPGANLLTSIDEGAADVFGTGITCSDDLVTCNPEFFELSLPGSCDNDNAPAYCYERRLDKPHCLDAGLMQMLQTQSYSDFTGGCIPYGCHYKLAAVFSSALWRATSDSAVLAELGAAGARKQVFQALWYAEGGGAGAPAGLTSWRDQLTNAVMDQTRFSLDSHVSTSASVLDAVIDGATSRNLKSALCSAFLDRFNAATNGITISRCPAGAQSYKECTPAAP